MSICNIAKLDKTPFEVNGSNQSLDIENKINKWVVVRNIFITIGAISLLISGIGYAGIVFQLASNSLLISLGAATVSFIFGLVFSNKAVNDFEKLVGNHKEHGLSGIINANNNCWLNSLMQILINSKSLRGELSKIDESFSGFVTDYVASVDEEPKAPNAQPIRIFLSNNLPDIVNNNQFQDLHEPLTYILDKIPKEPKNNLITRNHYRLGSDDEMISEVEEENNGILNLPIDNNLSENSINNLLDNYFRSEQSVDMGEVMIQEKRSVTVPCFCGLFTKNKMISIEVPKRKTLVLEERKLVSAPKDLFINVQRYISNPDIDVSFELNIEKDKFLNQENGNYVLDSFAIHTGKHYISYVCKNGIWFCCDDSCVYPVRKSEVLKAAKKAYVLHYTKSEKQSY